MISSNHIPRLNRLSTVTRWIMTRQSIKRNIAPRGRHKRRCGTLTIETPRTCRRRLHAKRHGLRRADNGTLLAPLEAAGEGVADENDGREGYDHDDGERDVDVVPLVGNGEDEADGDVDEANEENDGAQDQLVALDRRAVHPWALVPDVVSVVEEAADPLADQGDYE